MEKAEKVAEAADSDSEVAVVTELLRLYWSYKLTRLLEFEDVGPPGKLKPASRLTAS